MENDPRKKPRKKLPRGKRLSRGRWTLTPKAGKKRTFTGSLLGTFNLGTKRIVVLSVPKTFK